MIFIPMVAKKLSETESRVTFSGAFGGMVTPCGANTVLIPVPLITGNRAAATDATPGSACT